MYFSAMKLTSIVFAITFLFTTCTALVDDPVAFPTIKTFTPEFNADSSAILLKGEIQYVGGNPAEITARGFYWNRVGKPDSSDFHIEAGSGTGEFEGQIPMPEKGKVYFVKTYMVQIDEGLLYGNEMFISRPE